MSEIEQAIIAATHRIRFYRAIRRIERKLEMGAIDRIKEKAALARSIAPDAIKALENDLDSIIGEKAVLAQQQAEAISPHKDAIAGIKTEIAGIKSAMDILSNGGPPLQGSSTGSQLSVPDSITPEENKRAAETGMTPGTAEYYTFIRNLRAEAK